MTEEVYEPEMEVISGSNKPVFPIALSNSDLENLCSGVIKATLVGGEEFDPSKNYAKNLYFTGKLKKVNQNGFSFIYQIDKSKIGESRTIIPSEIEEESSLLDGIISKAKLYQQGDIYIVVNSHTNLHFDDSKYQNYRNFKDFLEG